MAEKSFFIEVLDKGFILHKNEKQNAVEEKATIDKLLVNTIIEMTNGLSSIGTTRNMSITITVDANLPTSANR